MTRLRKPFATISCPYVYIKKILNVSPTSFPVLVQEDRVLGISC